MPDGPESSQRSRLYIHWIQASNMMHTILTFVQFINYREFSLNPLVVLFRLNGFTISFTKPSSGKLLAVILL